MDRSTVYPTAVPRTEDFLRAQQRAMVALGSLIQASLGTATAVDGFTLQPTSPPSMSAVLGPGSVFQLENLEATPWSILQADTHSIMKQGILLDPTPLTFSPPATVGYAQNYLIQVQYQDLDDTPVLLQYFNSINPQVPIFGPAGNQQSQNTRRAGIVAMQPKAGISAVAGTQPIPTPDAGWAGLFVVTVAYGQTSITSGNIALYRNAPFITAKLPTIPRSVQNGDWVFAIDQGTANNIVITPNFPVTAYAQGQSFRVKVAAAPTGPTVININGLGNQSVVKSGGLALSGGEWAPNDIVQLNYDGTNFQAFGLGAGSSPAIVLTDLTMNVPTTQYPTIRQALLAASALAIPTNHYVTIAPAAGYIETLTAATGPLYLSHPFGQRIKIIGPPLNGAFPVYADVQGKTAADTLALLQSRFRVIINCIGVNGIELHSGYLNSMQNCLMVGDGSAGNYGSLIGNWSGEVGMGSVGFQNMGFHQFGADNVRAEQTSVIQVNNIVSTYAGRANFWMAHFSSMECNFGNILAYKGQYGIASFNSAMVMVDSASGAIDIRDPSSHGIYMPSFGKFNAIPASGVNITGCGGWGVLAYEQSQANFSNTVHFANNVSGDIYADYGSVCMLVGATVGTTSPARNTGANHYSYIAV